MFKFFLWFIFLHIPCFCFEVDETTNDIHSVYRKFIRVDEIFSNSKRHNFEVDDNQAANQKVQSLLAEITELLTRQLKGNLLENEKGQVKLMINDINQLLSDRWFHLNDPNAVDCSYNKFVKVFASSNFYSYFLPIYNGEGFRLPKIPEA